MAKRLNPTDCHVLINALNAEIYGANATIQAVDSSTFVSAGETAISAERTNVLNALSILVGRSIDAVRPYEDGAFRTIQEIDNGMYAQRFRKVSYYADPALSSGWFNTDLNGKNLGNGLENTSTGTLDSGANSGTGSMFEQHPKEPVEFFFGGANTWQYCITVYENQLKQAFRSEEEFARFFEGLMTEAQNDIEMEKEAFRRATVLNYMAGVIDLSASMPNSAKNMTALYNTYYGTSYTTAQLLSTYLESFMKFFVATVKEDVNRMTKRDLGYHWNPGAGASKYLLRHTPRSKQKLFLYRPLMMKFETMVFPALFNPEYLNIDNYEGIDTWQNLNDPMSIEVTPAIPNVSTPTSQTTGSKVSTKILGTLFDEDACLVNVHFDGAYASPIEARKGYYNTWYTFLKGAINDFTEKGIVYYMEDTDSKRKGPEPDPEKYVDFVDLDKSIEEPVEEPVGQRSQRNNCK